MRKILITFIIFYQKYISPFKPVTCRFFPSCSDYAIQAIQKYGNFRGTFLAVRRIIRCHPFHAGGYDPVPDR